MRRRHEVRTIAAAMGAILTTVGLVPAAWAQSDESFEQQYLFATQNAGAWTAQAFLFKDHADGPQYECRLSTPGLVISQVRASEGRTLESSWRLLRDRRKGLAYAVPKWIKLDGRRYEFTYLPWRLARAVDGIILTFDTRMPAVRRDARRQWLPVEYLTVDLLEARSLEVGYEWQAAGQKESASERRIIRLQGLSELAKWCGRMLLHDRLDQHHVRELTR